MLYKNKIKGQNILKSAVALMLMLTLSLSTALSPLAKAEEARHTWKTLTPGLVSDRLGEIYISPDGSKLFGWEQDTAHNTSFWMSADDGATWRKIWSKQAIVERVSIGADGSKIVLEYGNSFSISTDGGQSWVEKGPDPVHGNVLISPDGSFLVSCSGSGPTGYTTYISTNDGQTWTQKGTVTTVLSCPRYVSNNGSMIIQNYGDMARSTDYGQTWTETPGVLNVDVLPTSFSNNGNNIFEGDRISLDGGNHWTPSNAPIPAGYMITQTGISDDGKKLFVSTKSTTGANPRATTLLISVDGGRTWHSEDGASDYDMMAMSSDGSKLFYVYHKNNTVYRVGTLPAAQPVTPGSGAGGAVAPSTGSTSAALNQKPGKASGRLAETGISVQLIGGLAVVAVAAGALVLRKRL